MAPPSVPEDHVGVEGEFEDPRATHGTRDAADLDALDRLWMPLTGLFHADSVEANHAALLAAGPETRAIALALLLDGEVMNGGFEQYFTNTEGAYAEMTRAALDLLGEQETRTLFGHALAIYRQFSESDAGRDYDEFELALAELDERFDGEAFERRILAFAAQRQIEDVR